MAPIYEDEPKHKGPSASRKNRGYATQAMVAAYWRQVFPFAEPVGAGRSGRDITSTPGVAMECKAVADFSPMAYLRQTQRHADGDDIPCVILRPNGGGPSNIDEWPVIIPHHVFMEMVKRLTS